MDAPRPFAALGMPHFNSGEEVFEPAKQAKCQTCLDLSPNNLREQFRITHGDPDLNNKSQTFPVDVLARSADEDGCNGCRVLLAAVRNVQSRFAPVVYSNVELDYHEDSNGLDGLALTLRREFWNDKAADIPEETKRRVEETPDLVSIFADGRYINLKEVRPREYTPRYEIFISEEKRPGAESSSTWPAICTRPERSEDTGSEAALAWARKQLEKCKSSHSRCGAETAGLTLPTRVLDLGGRPDTDDIRLYETSGEVADYVTLSHCWGLTPDDPTLRPLETTKDTLEKFKRCIPWQSLPKTFRDAAIFTKRLGIRYLWIDSLCIIQGSAEDWAREAGKMASVYANATLTLAAASSINSRGGLFRKRPTCAELPPTKAGADDVYCIREFPNPDFFNYFHVDRPYGDDVSPLIQRAWVLQERLLSRRTLFFAPLELAWECAQHGESESGYPGPGASDKGLNKGMFGDLNVGSVQKEDLEQASKRWHDLVNVYTHLEIGFKSDKLPAIAGLARTMKPFFGDGGYSAGHWTETFLADLLWFRDTGGEGFSSFFYPADEIGPTGDVPSWSWAKTSQSKKFCKGPVMADLCEVEEVVYGKAGEEDAYMRVGPGYCCLSGYLFRVRLGEDDPFEGLEWRKRRHGQNFGRQDYDWSLQGPHHVPEDTEIWCMPVAVTPSTGATKYTFEAQMLVLRRVVVGDQQDRYQRIGLMSRSIASLGPFVHMLEGHDVLVRSLEQQIAFAESLPLENGTFGWSHMKAENHFRRTAVAEFDDVADTGIYAGFDDYFGLKYIEVLRQRLEAERRRVDAWREGKREHNYHKQRIVVI